MVPPSSLCCLSVQLPKTRQTLSMPNGETKLKLLLLSDLDGHIPRVIQLCEDLVSSDDCNVDAVLVSGGLVAKRGPHDYEALEAVAAAEGDMMALISRLEMIICRVLYIPDDGCDMVLVLRNSAVKSRLPEVESSFLAGLLPMLQSHKVEEPCALEIIGGSEYHPHAQLPLIYPGLFCWD
ncbi:hypothetical protein PsorP6_008200 [Peronosclerospora sorghi]|uniref:Uncharacterized protein n=1 Tax=Peronosclerospora sorghi TaxID=230839 RepID=A0ACC0WAE3_9STRA|nr:hypothetical protein PsorP6_008200 [Peronosclerospora sorghi]